MDDGEEIEYGPGDFAVHGAWPRRLDRRRRAVRRDRLAGLRRLRQALTGSLARTPRRAIAGRSAGRARGPAPSGDGVHFPALESLSRARRSLNGGPRRRPLPPGRRLVLAGRARTPEQEHEDNDSGDQGYPDRRVRGREQADRDDPADHDRDLRNRSEPDPGLAMRGGHHRHARRRRGHRLRPSPASRRRTGHAATESFPHGVTARPWSCRM